jgi:hypothetical protein
VEWRARASRQQARNDMAVYVGAAEVAALEAVGEFLVIETAEVGEGGLKVGLLPAPSSHDPCTRCHRLNLEANFCFGVGQVGMREFPRMLGVVRS